MRLGLHPLYDSRDARLERPPVSQSRSETKPTAMPTSSENRWTPVQNSVLSCWQGCGLGFTRNAIHGSPSGPLEMYGTKSIQFSFPVTRSGPPITGRLDSQSSVVERLG
jgi:hypothetical protein